MRLRIGACMATALALALGGARVEQCGDGRVISSGPDPFYRGYTEGAKRLIWNAVVQPDP
jgi:hypothetical protein